MAGAWEWQKKEGKKKNERGGGAKVASFSCLPLLGSSHYPAKTAHLLFIVFNSRSLLYAFAGGYGERDGMRRRGQSC